MKISVDDKEIFTLSELQKQIIMHYIPSEIFEDDMKRRLHYILTHKCEKCLEGLKLEWIPKLKAQGVKIPDNDEDLANLVLAQPDYKNRSTRDAEEKLFRDSILRGNS